jgi:hypothetical protein
MKVPSQPMGGPRYYAPGDLVRLRLGPGFRPGVPIFPFELEREGVRYVEPDVAFIVSVEQRLARLDGRPSSLIWFIAIIYRGSLGRVTADRIEWV